MKKIIFIWIGYEILAYVYNFSQTSIENETKRNIAEKGGTSNVDFMPSQKLPSLIGLLGIQALT